MREALTACSWSIRISHDNLQVIASSTASAVTTDARVGVEDSIIC